MIVFLLLFALGINDIAPVEVASAQSLHEHLRRCGVGGKRYLILVAQALYLVDIVKARGVGRVAEEQNEVYLVVRYSCAYLLCAALIGVHVKRHGQSRSLRHELAGGICRTNGVLGQNTAIGYTELKHQFFLNS